MTWPRRTRPLFLNEAYIVPLAMPGFGLVNLLT